MGRRKFERNWADLQVELVTIIAVKATTTNAGYVHLRSVCKAWRRALTPYPRHLPPQSPWFLLPGFHLDPSEREGSDCPELSFYDIFQGKTHRFRLPYLRGKYLCGSSHGWLAVQHDYRVSLFNPITQNIIELPSLDAPPSIVTSVPSRWGTHSAYKQYLIRVLLSCNPSEAGCIVGAWFLTNSIWELGFCRIQDTHWTGLRMKDVPRIIADWSFHKNKIYAFDYNRNVSIYDPQDLSVRIIPSKIRYTVFRDEVNIVGANSESGGPLIIKSTRREKPKYFVYRWFDDRQQWRRVRNIGKQVIFVNWMGSIILQFEKGRKNELYYEASLPLTTWTFQLVMLGVHLGSGKDVQHIINPMEEFHSGLWMSLWFTPSLCGLNDTQQNPSSGDSSFSRY